MLHRATLHDQILCTLSDSQGFAPSEVVPLLRELQMVRQEEGLGELQALLGGSTAPATATAATATAATEGSPTATAAHASAPPSPSAAPLVVPTAVSAAADLVPAVAGSVAAPVAAAATAAPTTAAVRRRGMTPRAIAAARRAA